MNKKNLPHHPKVFGLEAFRESGVEVGQLPATALSPTLAVQETTQAGQGAGFPQFGSLTLGNFDGSAEAGLGFLLSRRPLVSRKIL